MSKYIVPSWDGKELEEKSRHEMSYGEDEATVEDLRQVILSLQKRIKDLELAKYETTVVVKETRKKKST